MVRVRPTVNRAPIARKSNCRARFCQRLQCAALRDSLAPVGILDSLYSMGAETAASAAVDNPPGAVAAAHAMGGIKVADRLAAQVHREVETRASPRFKLHWRKFYNEWLTYKTLNAQKETQADPARVLEKELPGFTRRLYEWRDALERESGRNVAVGADGHASKPGNEITWRPIAALAGAVVRGVLLKSWLSSREKLREQERAEALETERQRIMTLTAPAPQLVLPPEPQTVYYATPPLMPRYPPPHPAPPP